jgi:peptidoglycan/LPS O-acetylase OafA/YrhL
MAQGTLQAATPISRHRFHLLDGLRGIAAMFVILAHTPVYLLPRYAPRNPFLAVDFFFCLSGFVIAFSYERRLAEGLTFFDFLRARFIRLFPVYLLGSILGFGLLLTVDSHMPGMAGPGRKIVLFVLGLFLLPNLVPSMSVYLFPLIMPAWSLFFEVVANIGYAALVLRTAAKSWVLLLGMLLSAILLLHYVTGGGSFELLGWPSDPHVFYLSLSRVALSFAAGVLTLRLYRALPHPDWLKAPNWVLPIAMTCALLFLLESPFAFMGSGYFQLLCAIGLFPVTVLCGAWIHVPSRLTSLCIVLGDISYPMYLLHPIFLRPLIYHQIRDYVLHRAIALSLCLPATIVVIAVASYLAARYYDAPLRKWLNTRRRAAAV